MGNFDFNLSGHGTVFTLTPLSDTAIDWVAENLPDDSITLGEAIVVEHRYIGPILEGIDADGMTVANA